MSTAKDSLPEPPSNPFQGFFSGKPASWVLVKHATFRAFRFAKVHHNACPTCVPSCRFCIFLGFDSELLKQVAASLRRLHRTQPPQ